MASLLTFDEVMAISKRLMLISDTWADLWMSLHFLPVNVGRIIDLRFSDVDGNSLILKRKGQFGEIRTSIPSPVVAIIQRRKLNYPDDVFIFQSHSNRVKAAVVPVTVIAFNAALKKAADGVTSKSVSSKSASIG
ncbi:hypothetical protein [Yokenella regensburgei]|uniref:hypothetical protein n=1 Tax=Yokenella regensburgei TaxID=158877 RepID=UPI00056E4DC9